MFKETVSNKKKFLSSLVKAPMAAIEQAARARWSDCDALADYFLESLCRLPHCQLLYAINTNGTQYCGSVTRNGIDDSWKGRDLAARPYFSGNLPFRGMILSDAYLSQRSMQPCITTIQAVNYEGQLLGFIAADFHLKDLPITNTSTLQRMHLQKSQHHPASGHGSKLQQNSQTRVDENIDYLIYAITTLMQEHGVFHCKLHFSAERCNLWSYQDPLDYQLHTVEELMSNDLLDKYPAAESYNSRNTIPAGQIPLVFTQLKALRQSDDTVFLTSGSLNLVNGMVNLTLSTGGTHYMKAEEFLNHDLGYWLNNKEPEIKADILSNSTPN